MGVHLLAATRPPAVAGSFYPGHPDALRALVDVLVAEAARRHSLPSDIGEPAGILVPHAGLEYSGVVAAAAWRLLGETGPAAGPGPATVVLLGTNHAATWLDGIGVWDRGAWHTPLGTVTVDHDLAARVIDLGHPFMVDREAHLAEHSIEVQLPFLQVLAPAARIVPLATSAGIGAPAVAAGAALGRLLASERAVGRRVLLAISTDMAHYPSHDEAGAVTEYLRSAILEMDADSLAARERAVRLRRAPGLVCGMCGIEPAVVGLAALRAAGAGRGIALASATSADAGGPASRTVGYLAAAFPIT